MQYINRIDFIVIQSGQRNSNSSDKKINFSSKKTSVYGIYFANELLIFLSETTTLVFQNEYFQSILFFLCLMKNPFLNTDNYAVVREFKRLKTKKRSISDSDFSSSSSSYSPSIRYTDFSSFTPKHAQKPFNRGQKQYLICKQQKQAQIQSLRAQVFGIQELRYHPQYFEEISNKSDKYCQQEKLINHKAQFPDENQQLKKKKTLKTSQHQTLYQSVKKVQILQQLKYQEKKYQNYQFQQINQIGQQTKNESPYKYSAKKIKNKNQYTQPQRFHNEGKTKSMIQSMLSIKINKNDQVRTDHYQSSSKFQSRIQFEERNPKINRSVKKKCSLFERLRNSEQSEQQQQNSHYKISVNKVDSEIHHHMQQIDMVDEIVEQQKSLKSSNFQTTGTKVSTNYDDSRDPSYLMNPPVIYIRNKIFYLNQACKRKMKTQFQ